MATRGSGVWIPAAIYLVANCLAHYKAEEEKLSSEWLERKAYREVVLSLVAKVQ